MKKTIKKIILSSLLLTSITLPTHEIKAAEQTQSNNTSINKVCQTYKLKDCYNHTNVYLFKAVSSYKLQDLTYYDTYEVSKHKLKKGAFYEVVYYHDLAIKEYCLTNLSHHDKIMLQYSYQAIKQQQKANNYISKPVTKNEVSIMY